MSESFWNRMIHLFNESAFIDLIITRSARVVMIVFLVLIVVRLLKRLEKVFVDFAVHRLHVREGATDPVSAAERDKRLATVSRVIWTSLRVAIVSLAVVMGLREFGFDIRPLLTGAGIAGVAVGFGAQSLVKDIISGIFLLLENQIRVGDAVKIGPLGGTVERLELRTTVLRDADGTLHIIPNGEIKAVSNMTYKWGRSVVDVPLAYQADMEHASRVLKEVGENFIQDPAWKMRLIGQPEVVGLTDFEPAYARLRIQVRTLPEERWAVERELRRRIKIALDEAGIPLAGTRAAK